MGVKGNGKGRPLVKGDFSEVEDAEDDAEDYEEEQAEEERFRSSTFATTTPVLRDRSQLKKPSYVECTEDGQDSMEDDFHPTVKKTKRQSRSTRKAQIHDFVDIATTASSSQPGHMGAMKTEYAPHSPYDFPVEPSPNGFSNSNSSPVQPIVNYFGNQGNINDNTTSFNSAFFSSGFGYYPPSAYQPFGQPMYVTTQPLVQQQLTCPHELDATKGHASKSFDNSSGADPYSSDPVTDEADIPDGFCESEWYNNYAKQTPQP